MLRVSVCLRSGLSPLLRGSVFGMVLGLGLLMGCSGFSSNDQPLPDSTFTRVLTELHMASSRQSRDVPMPPGLRDSIFARYDVDPSEFEATLRHYTRRPDRFETMYQAVIDTLQAQRHPNRTRSGTKTIPDSLRKRTGDTPDAP